MVQESKFDIMVHLRFWVAAFAMWFCGCPTLYWTDPQAWEEYMSVGKPYGASDDTH